MWRTALCARQRICGVQCYVRIGAVSNLTGRSGPLHAARTSEAALYMQHASLYMQHASTICLSANLLLPLKLPLYPHPPFPNAVLCVCVHLYDLQHPSIHLVTGVNKEW